MKRLRFGKEKIALLLLAVLPFCGCVGQSGASSLPERPTSSMQGTSSGRLPDDKPVWTDASSHAFPSDRISTALPQVQTPFACAAMRVEYEKLPSAALRTAYDEMLKAVAVITPNRNERGEYRTASILLEGLRLDERALRLVLSALRSDHPQIFWLANRFGYDSDAPGGTVVELYSHYSAKECGQRVKKLAQAVRTFCRVLNKNQTVFYRELALHDALLTAVAYDDAAVDSADAPEAFTAYGALVEGKAVCQGYALAMKLLLCYADIESTVVSGSSQGVAHAWNAVCLGGNWYYLDATWNDTEQRIRYDYFNLTEAILRQDHAVDPVYPDGEGEQFNLALPECTADAMNYFVRCAVPLDGFDEENDRRLLTRLQSMLMTGSTMLTVRFAPAMDYEESVAMLISGQPYKLIYLMQYANELSSSVNSFSMDDIHYTTAKAQNAVTLWLEIEQP